MIKPLIRTNVVVGVVVTLVCLGGAAFATSFEPVLPASPDPAAFDPQLTVTPSDNLVDGQVVSVDGKRFGADADGVLRECTRDLALCSPQQTPFTSGRNAAFGPHGNPQTSSDPNSVPVNFTVHTSFVPAGSSTAVNCSPSNCILDAFSDQGFQIRRACHHLSFGTLDATPCTQPSSATTSTSLPSTTTTAPTTSTTSGRLSAAACASLQATRAGFNLQISAREAAASGPGADRIVATLERSRASGNARYDNLLAGCPPA